MNNRIKQLKEFESSIKYEFEDIQLLNIALTHSSFSNENKNCNEHNERLEFLGDSIANLIVTDLLFHKLSDLPEGVLTKMRASFVCESSFADASKCLGIPKYILLGKGEELSGGRSRDSLLADAFEAFCGALYLDAGFAKTKEFLLDNFKNSILNDIKNTKEFSDYKTALQEFYHKKYRGRVKYRLLKEEGPDHNKNFYVSVNSDEAEIGYGMGKSKKEAEHNAAKDALTKLGYYND